MLRLASSAKNLPTNHRRFQYRKALSCKTQQTRSLAEVPDRAEQFSNLISTANTPEDWASIEQAIREAERVLETVHVPENPARYEEKEENKPKLPNAPELITHYLDNDGFLEGWLSKVSHFASYSRPMKKISLDLVSPAVFYDIVGEKHYAGGDPMDQDSRPVVIAQKNTNRYEGLDRFLLTWDSPRRKAEIMASLDLEDPESKEERMRKAEAYEQSETGGSTEDKLQHAMERRQRYIDHAKGEVDRIIEEIAARRREIAEVENQMRPSEPKLPPQEKEGAQAEHKIPTNRRAPKFMMDSEVRVEEQDPTPEESKFEEPTEEELTEDAALLPEEVQALEDAMNKANNIPSLSEFLVDETLDAGEAYDKDKIEKEAPDYIEILEAEQRTLKRILNLDGRPQKVLIETEEEKMARLAEEDKIVHNYDESVALDLRRGYRFGLTEEDVKELPRHVKEFLQIHRANKHEILGFRKRNAVINWGKDAWDSGNPAVQVVVMTERIMALTEHMYKNKKDKRTNHALAQVLAKRRRMMIYLKKKNPEDFFRILKAYNLRDVI
eukprot:TRINITY_DN11299_c0_g1_i1.p1 TRINITY_DN11299_c0_g1~~TRINITY_DN11299_c0_g1_i1.p1  ORF type:complete len:554 (-),score=116.08 TRINITY_DN11299_c0_g1_i1:127-1788(-)